MADGSANQQHDPKQEHEQEQYHNGTHHDLTNQTNQSLHPSGEPYQPQHQPYQPPPPSFDDEVEQFFITLGELHHQCSSTHTPDTGVPSIALVQSIGTLCETLFQHSKALQLSLGHGTGRHENGTQQNGNEDASLHTIMAQNCHEKCVAAFQTAISTLTSPTTRSKLVPDGPQHVIAHVVELYLYICSDDDTSKACIENYGRYQTTLLKQRIKPHIATLVSLRRTSTLRKIPLAELEPAQPPHASTITAILSEATILMQPFQNWGATTSHPRISMLCEHCLHVLDVEAQSRATTIGEWFRADHDLDGILTSHTASDATNRDANRNTTVTVEGLDAVLEELSTVCQLYTRYIRFQANGPTSSSALSNTTDEYSMLYGTIETSIYAPLSISHALQTPNTNSNSSSSQPVEIMDFVYVPAYVEDVYYICSRLINRALNTFCENAVNTVVLRIGDCWSRDGTESTSTGVYRALVEEWGCDMGTVPTTHQTEANGSKSSSSSAPNSGNIFASALLDAIDTDDIHSGNMHMPSLTTKSKIISPPPSSGIRRKQSCILESNMCALNGVASASSACQALSDLLQSIIDTRLEEHQEQLENTGTCTLQLPPDATELTPCQTQMLESARDDFVAHSHSYRQLLTAKVTNLVETYCGSPTNAPPTNPSSSHPPLHPGASARRGLITGGFISMLSAKTPSTSTQSKMNTLTPRLPFTTNANVTTTTALIPAIQQALHQQPYNITSSAEFDQLESEDVLDPAFRQPFRTNLLLTSLGNHTNTYKTRHCGAEPTVLSEIVRVLTRNLVNVFLTLLLSPLPEGDTNPLSTSPTFTDWGSLLLSKQVRILESELCRLIVPSLAATQNGSNGDAHKPSSSVTQTSVTMITQQFQKLNQAVTILQLERPIDWLAMRYSDNSTSSHGNGNGNGNGNGPDADDGSHRLTKEEIRWLMGRRVDFSPDAIAKVCDQL